MKRLLVAVSLSIGLIGPSHALMSFLVAQWWEGGNQMCKYDNGTILNMGARLCPLSIGG